MSNSKGVQYSKQSQLHFFGSDLVEFSKNLKGPTYAYSRSALVDRAKSFLGFFPKASVHFAMKANFQPEVLKVLRNCGIGVDAVSAGEIQRALQLGFDLKQIVFSGMGKTVAELEYAVDENILQIHIESFAEIQMLQKIAARKQKRVAILLRMNPELSVPTHRHISTGHKSAKFGLSAQDWKRAVVELRRCPNLIVRGVSFHLGSSLLKFEVLKKAISKAHQQLQVLQKKGHPAWRLDVGGGLGIDYGKDAEVDVRLLKNYSEVLQVQLDKMNRQAKASGSVYELFLEPGRFLVARAGVLLTPITLLKDQFVVVEAGMNHFMRPALYGVEHRILPLILKKGLAKKFSVVGPICESTDVFTRRTPLVRPQAGEWLAILDVGAYGESMSSDYNLRPRAQSILIED